MNEKMINRFLLLKTDRASTSQLEISAFKHLLYRHFPLGGSQAEKQALRGALDFQIASAGKSITLKPLLTSWKLLIVNFFVES